MKELYLEDLKDFKAVVEESRKDEGFSIMDEEGNVKYLVFPYELLDRLSKMTPVDMAEGTNVKVMTPDGQVPELSFDEYEAIKSSLIKTLEENFKPKADKLN